MKLTEQQINCRVADLPGEEEIDPPICPECEEPVLPGDEWVCTLCDRTFHQECVFGCPDGYLGAPVCYPCAYGDSLTDEWYKGQKENERG